MIKEAMDEMKSLVKKSTEIVEVGGLPYCYEGLNLIKNPLPLPLKVMSLESIVSLAEDENEEGSTLMLHVESPTKVVLMEENLDDFNRQVVYGIADVSDQVGDNFNFGHGYDLESFIVNLQGAFVQTENLTKLIDAVSRVRIENEDDIEDDGVSQTVKAKAGIHLSTTVELPNPIVLNPYKTFPEIDPPNERFTFRVSKGRHGGVEFKLFNSKSMAWELICVNAIKEYLKEESGLTVI